MFSRVWVTQNNAISVYVDFRRVKRFFFQVLHLWKKRKEEKNERNKNKNDVAVK